MVGIIDLLTGFESQLIPMTNTVPAAQTITLPVTGWAWWFVVTATVTVNNAAAALSCNPLVKILSGSTLVFSGVSSAQITAGNSEVISFGVGLPGIGIAGVRRTSGLPFLPVLDEGSIVLGSDGGDVNTAILAANCVIIGRRKHTSRPK